MSANVDAMVREAIRAYRAGNKAEARQLLERATEIDSYNEQAWMWLSGMVDTPEEQRICLENVLVINPDNQNAQMGLKALKKTSPLPKLDDDAYNVPTSSISGNFSPVNQPSTAEYDDWIANMGIGSSASPSAVADDVDDDDPMSDLFGDVFEDPEPSRVSVQHDDMLDELRNYVSDTDDDYGVDDYGDYDDDEEDDVFAPTGSYTADGPFTASNAFVTEDDDFGDEDALFQQSTPSSPVPKATSMPRSPATRPKAKGQAEVDPGHYFKMIPEGIRATHVPGMSQGISPLVWVGLVVLIIGNLAAAAILVTSLLG